MREPIIIVDDKEIYADELTERQLVLVKSIRNIELKIAYLDFKIEQFLDGRTVFLERLSEQIMQSGLLDSKITRRQKNSVMAQCDEELIDYLNESNGCQK